MSFVFLLLFVVEISIFLIIDYHKYGTIYTPALFLGFPFAVILTLAVLLGPHIGFYPVREYAIVIWCLGLGIFWTSGNFFTFAVIPTKVVSPFANIKSNSSITACIRLISWVFLLFLLISFIRSYLHHGNISSEGFSRDFAGGGIAAHSLSLIKFNIAYLIAARDTQKIQSRFIVIFSFIFLFLYNVKGGLFITVLVSLFSVYLTSQSKVSISKLFSIILAGIIIFSISYKIALGDNLRLDFLVYHFFTYLFAGILGLGEHLRQGLPTNIDFLLVIQPVINIYNFLTGGEIVNTLSSFWVPISDIHAKQSNVKTFFGDIYLYSGMLKGMLFISFLGLLSYFFLALTIIQKSFMYLILYLFMISSFMLGWFSYYFNSLFYYEVIVYAFIVILFSKIIVSPIKAALTPEPDNHIII